MTSIPATIPERIPLPAAAAPPADAGAGLTAGDIVGMLKRRAIMLILLWMFFGMIAVGAFFVVYYKYPTYTAEAWVECISNRPDQTETLIQQALVKDEHERFINSQAALMESPEVLNDVLQTPEVRSTTWFKETEESLRFLELVDALGSAPIRNTNYIRVSMRCRVKEDPAKIVEQVVARYYDLVQTQAKNEYRDQRSEYKENEGQLTDQLNEKLQQIARFKADLPPGADVDETGIVYEELRALAVQVAALELQTSELEGMSQMYNDPTGPGVSPEDRQMVENDPMVHYLANQLFAYQQEFDSLMQTLGSQHRQVKDMGNRLEVTQRQLAELRDQKLQEVIDLQREMIRTAFLNSQNQLFLAREQMALKEAAQSDLDRKRTHLQQMLDELASLQKRLDGTVEFIGNLERVIQDKQTIKVNIARHAIPPLERSGPHLIWLPAGVILSLLLSAGLVFLLELTDTSVRTPQDIVRHLTAAMLGTVPDVDDEEAPIDQVETAVRDAPNSMIAEAFRTIRTNLQFSAPADRQRTVMITSPRPEDGKTTIASNLGTSIAQGGRRVLLVDANFRRPALHKLYASANDTGLSNILVGDATLESAVRRTDVANLDVLLSGPIPPNPAERLASPQIQEFLEAAAARYDQVIIDAPPVLLATDATVLATRVDGAILVCRAKENSRGAAQRACDLLMQVDAHLFGAILNAAQTRRGGYFREQMSTFYDYQPEEALEQDTKPALPAQDGGEARDTEPTPETEEPPR